MSLYPSYLYLFTRRWARRRWTPFVTNGRTQSKSFAVRFCSRVQFQFQFQFFSGTFVCSSVILSHLALDESISIHLANEWCTVIPNLGISMIFLFIDVNIHGRSPFCFVLEVHLLSCYSWNRSTSLNAKIIQVHEDICGKGYTFFCHLGMAEI